MEKMTKVEEKAILTQYFNHTCIPWFCKSTTLWVLIHSIVGHQIIQQGTQMTRYIYLVTLPRKKSIFVNLCLIPLASIRFFRNKI